MQNRKNVSRLSIALLTVLLMTVPLRAQVTVGDTEAPHPFSLLELVAKSPVVGGLRLPQLSDAQCGDLKTFFTSGTTSSEDKAAAEGLVVYNTDVHCLFFWGGGDWMSASYETPDPHIVRTSKTSQRIGEGASAMMSVVATGTDALLYQWYSGSAGNETAPIGAAQSSSYTPRFAIAGVYNYWCKVSNSCGSVNSSQFTVTVVACGAYIAAGVWKKFMCYNLGVTNPSADPFEPSADLIGDYYYFGSPTPAGNRDGIFGVWGSADDPSLYYGDGIFHSMMSEENNQTIKSPTDPCPDGYRVPNYYEWDGVTKNNTWTPQGTFADDGNYTSGQQVGEALFLPAAGARDKDTGNLGLLGKSGFYWSASAYLTSHHNHILVFDYSTISADALTSPSISGYLHLSIRCIEE